jgi:16S rRNA (cytidine1402-2'-O)-methyltransferase
MPPEGGRGRTEPAVLYVVSTPIGNLEDITLRALRVLREADVVAAEDTRHTQVLLRAHGIDRRLVSYHEHNEAERSRELLECLERGRSVAVVSDAGTPGVSDPAYRIVRAAIDAGHRVVPVPGASAVLTALILAGFPSGGFASAGFLPLKGGARTNAIERILDDPRPTVFFESPRRTARTLAEFAARAPDRQAAVLREMTKVHEEARRGTLRLLAEQAAGDPPRGEVVVVVAGVPREAPELELSPAARAERDRLVAGGLEADEATRRVIEIYGAGRRRKGGR